MHILQLPHIFKLPLKLQTSTVHLFKLLHKITEVEMKCLCPSVVLRFLFKQSVMTLEQEWVPVRY